MTAKKERHCYLDFLRVFAAFLVVFNHTEGFHLYLEQPASASPGFVLLTAAAVFTKVNIPLFLMLSGALLLGREESYRELLRRRILRFAAILVVFSALIYTVRDGKTLFHMDFLRALFSGEVTLSYWFLFSYLAFLCCLPILRKIAVHMTREDMFFLVGARILLCSLLPLYQYWSSALGVQPVFLRADFQIPFSTMNFLFYPLLGFWLCNRCSPDAFRPRHGVVCAAVLAAGVGIATLTTCHQGLTGQMTQDYLVLFQCPITVAFFLLVRGCFQKITPPKWFADLLARLSSFTLGVYLLEPLLNHFLYYRYGSSLDRMLYSVLWCIFSLCICSLAAYLLKKLPVIGRLL